MWSSLNCMLPCGGAACSSFWAVSTGSCSGPAKHKIFIPSIARRLSLRLRSRTGDKAMTGEEKTGEKKTREKKMTMGVIVGNRGFFPDHLAKSGREEIIRALEAASIDVVALTPEQSKYGAVETREESKRCSELFKKNRERIDGVIVTLPNFGDERAIADTLRLADLRVPVLIQATPDDPGKMTIAFPPPPPPPNPPPSNHPPPPAPPPSTPP